MSELRRTHQDGISLSANPVRPLVRAVEAERTRQQQAERTAQLEIDRVRRDKEQAATMFMAVAQVARGIVPIEIFWTKPELLRPATEWRKARYGQKQVLVNGWLLAPMIVESHSVCVGEDPYEHTGIYTQEHTYKGRLLGDTGHYYEVTSEDLQSQDVGFQISQRFPVSQEDLNDPNSTYPIDYMELLTDFVVKHNLDEPLRVFGPKDLPLRF